MQKEKCSLKPSHDLLLTLHQLRVIVLTCMRFHFHQDYNISFITNKINCPVSMTAAFDAMQTFKKDINFTIQELKEA